MTIQARRHLLENLAQKPPKDVIKSEKWTKKDYLKTEAWAEVRAWRGRNLSCRGCRE